MSLKWIGKGVLKVGDKLLKHGDNIPKNFDKKRLKKFKTQGLIGAIIEPVEAEKDDSKPSAKS
jgi:hypothetical protein